MSIVCWRKGTLAPPAELNTRNYCTLCGTDASLAAALALHTPHVNANQYISAACSVQCEPNGETWESQQTR
eukprot:5704013-Amphidinium_carterae.1